MSSAEVHLRVFPCGCLRLSLTGCCFGCGDAAHGFNKTDKAAGPRLVLFALFIFWGDVNLREVAPSFLCRDENQSSHQVNMQANAVADFFFFFCLLLLCRQGARLQSTLRAVSQEHQFLRPAKTSAGKTS